MQMDRLYKAVARMDGWLNSVIGMGGTRDKTTFTTFAPSGIMADEALAEIYDEADMAALICDLLPQEALKSGFKLRVKASRYAGENIEQSKKLQDSLNDALGVLGLQQKLLDAAVWSRVYGACALFIDVDDGRELFEPMGSYNTINKIEVIEKPFLSPELWEQDKKSAGFGKPATYRFDDSGKGVGMVSAGFQTVHTSRLIFLPGTRTSTFLRRRNDGWEISLLQRCDQVLKEFGLSWGVLGHLIADSSQGVFKISGLIDAMAENDTSVIETRMSLIDRGRSALRSIILDADTEEFTRQSATWTGMSEPFRLLILKLSAITRYPVPVLMGEAPAGLNATGDSSIRMWYDQVEGFRSNTLDPVINRVVKMLMQAKKGVTKGQELNNYFIDWPSMWLMSPTERMNVREAQSRIDNTYITAQVMTPDEVGLSRFTAEGWSDETEIDLSVRSLEREEIEEEKEAEPAPMAETVDEDA
jgi:phage-related protein (TIGR01555 family)